MKIKIPVKRNSKSRLTIEGYPHKISRFKKKIYRNGVFVEERDMLRFNLMMLNPDPTDSRNTFVSDGIWVEVQKNRAVVVGKWLTPYLLIEVEGKLRRVDHKGEWEILADYIQRAEAEMVEIDVEVAESDIPDWINNFKGDGKNEVKKER